MDFNRTEKGQRCHQYCIFVFCQGALLTESVCCVCRFGALERCKELVEAGYDVRQPDKENVSLLHWAAINNRADLVKYYIAKGAVIDQLGGDLNSTPLHWAIRQGHLQMVIQLLRYGADPSLADGEGYRGLHLAVLFQHMPIAAYLMAKGQEVDVPDSNGQTSLMLAAQKIIGPEPTNFLLKCNASVNAVDKVNRNSPLHCAVLAGNVDAVHILLEAGASVDLQNANVRPSACVQCMFSVCVLWAVGAVLDMNSESWLLKGVLLACILAVINLTCRYNIVVLAEAGCLDPRIFCTSCMMRKPMRAHHCFICNACIAKQDHHSVWINGCIGARNHQFFVLFLITLNLLGVWMFYGSIKYWTNHCMAESSEQNLWAFVTGLVGCSPWVLYVFCMAFFHVTWASILLAHQLYQIAFLGLTTAERSSLMHSQRKLPHSSLRQNPFNRGVLKNLVNFFQLRCCGLCKPMVLDWTQEFPMGLNRDHPMFNSMDPV
uniref:Palmitoyltransferase n=1 Tax=Pygocentrus nattereri TaxID=42514 RepID=A0AAR2JH34_PYGNA